MVCSGPCRGSRESRSSRGKRSRERRRSRRGRESRRRQGKEEEEQQEQGEQGEEDEDQAVRGTVEVAGACCLSPRAASASSKDPSVWRWRERGSNPLVTLRSCAALTGCLASQCVCLLICKMGVILPTS